MKTSIVIDSDLWEEFKPRVGSKKGMKALSRAIKEEIPERLIIEALKELIGFKEKLPLVISPVKPKVKNDAGKTVRELRRSRT